MLLKCIRYGLIEKQRVVYAEIFLNWLRTNEKKTLPPGFVVYLLTVYKVYSQGVLG